MFVLVEMHVFLNFIILGRGSIFLEFIFFNFIILKFYSAYQCVPRRRKSKHWSKWASFQESWYILKYKAPLISVGTNFVQPSWNCKQFQLEHPIKLRVLGPTVDYKLSIFPPGYVGEIPAHNTTVSSVNADSVIVTSCDVTLWHYDVMMTSSVTIPPVSVICSSRNCREYVWHEMANSTSIN